MKTVTIPEGMNPFVVYSNGVKYVYSPGETVEVPDGVAIEIEEYRDAQNKKPGAVDAPFDSDCCDSGGSGGGGTNSDVVHIGAEAPTDNAALWVDTDEEGAIPWDAISDKPFYEHRSDKTIVEIPLTTIQSESQGHKFYDVPEEMWDAIGVNKSYKMSIDGMVYDVEVSIDGGAYVLNVPNVALSDGTTFMYIQLFQRTNKLGIAEAYGVDLTPYTVTIYEPDGVVEIKKLDPKFIPGSTVLCIDFDFNDGEEQEFGDGTPSTRTMIESQIASGGLIAVRVANMGYIGYGVFHAGSLEGSRCTFYTFDNSTVLMEWDEQLEKYNVTITGGGK